MTSRSARIVQVASEEEVETAAALFSEYAASLDIDLCFQGFDEEVAGLPGEYAPPRGALFLAIDEGRAVGCVGLRPHDWPAIAELKRLYVRADSRSRGLGKSLSLAALAFAREAGYERVRLDTLPTMVEARSLYEALGFTEISAYRFNPVPDVCYMELVLGPPGPGPARD